MAFDNIVIEGELGNEFEIGTRITSKVTIRTDDTSVVRAPDGTLFSPAPTYDNTTHILQFPDVNGVATPPFDLSSLTTDIFVNGGSLSGTVLTLVDNDGVTPDLTIDLASLLGPSTDPDNLLGTGGDGKPTITAANLSAATDTTCQSVFGTDLFKAFAP